MKNNSSVTRIAPLCAALLTCTPLLAADLLDIYREALSRDPVYASARYAFDAGKEAIPLARTGVLPSISLAAGYNRNHREIEIGRAHV